MSNRTLIQITLVAIAIVVLIGTFQAGMAAHEFLSHITVCTK